MNNVLYTFNHMELLFWELLHKVFIEIITMCESIKKKKYIYYDWYSAWDFEYLIIIFNPSFDFFINNFLIYCTWYEIQRCPLHRIKLNLKILFISIFTFFWNTFIYAWKI
jgi:hypothetical protein